MRRQQSPFSSQYSHATTFAPAKAIVGLLLALLLIAGLLVVQPAAAQIPSVSNIGYGHTIPGEITSPRGVEHIFTGCVGETVGMSVTANDFSPRIELYGPEEDEALASATAPTSSNTVTLEGITLPTSGVYIIVVSGRSRGDRGGYSVTLEGDGPDNPLPDDGNVAINLLYGESVTGTIAPDGSDRWNFRGCAGDEILAKITADDFTPSALLFIAIAESAIAEGAIEGDTLVLRRVLPDNAVYDLYVGGQSDTDAGDYTLELTLEARGVPLPTTPTPTAEATVISEESPTPTATTSGTPSSGPRPRRGIPTPKSGTTPAVTPTVTPTRTPPASGPTATPTPEATPEFIMPGLGEGVFNVIDVSSRGGPVNFVAYSPDGAVIATAGEDGAVRVWDSLTGELVQTLEGHEDRVNYVAFAPNDEWIASAGDDGTVRLWDQVGRQAALLEMPDKGVNSIAFSPDSTLLVAASDGDTALVWNVADESVSMELQEHMGPVFHAIFSPDGSMIATGDSDGVVRLWDVTGGGLVDSIPANAGPGRSDPVLSVAFSNDSTALVVGGVIGVNAASVQIWDINTGDRIGELLGHREWGSTATISPDDAYILSAGRAEPGHDGPVSTQARLWNTETGALAIALVGYPASVVTAAFSPDGDELLTSDGMYVYIWPAQMIDVFAATFGEAVGVQVPVPTATATPVAPNRTPTATPTSAATLTPTPTLIPTATVTPTPLTPTVSLEIFCTVITDRLNLRPGPGTNFNPIIDVLETGELLVVTGRNADSTWLEVAVLDVNLEVEQTGWVSADFVFCVGEIGDTPVVEVDN